MWKITAFANNSWSPITNVIEVKAQPPSTKAVHDAVIQPFLNSPGFLGHLTDELETEPPLFPASGRRDAIELWSKAAEEEAREFDWASPSKIVAIEEALALYLQDESDNTAATLAWHDHTAVIIPITSQVEQIAIEYTPSLRDENRTARLRHRYASADHVLETTLDWRGYFGENSEIVDAWTTMRQRHNSFFCAVRGMSGYIVAYVLRRLCKPKPTLTIDRDPIAQHRLIWMSEHYPKIADGFPDLSRTSSAHHERALIFVHGTASCCIQGLKDLYSGGAPGFPVYRYEHDTFRKVDENGDELADLIAKRVHADKLLLVAHSRGGLVAKWALNRLMRNGYRAEVQLYTLGTPHLGTPLANMGGRLLNHLFKLGGEIIKGIPVLMPIAWAYSVLIDAPTLPPGIDVMREGSETLSMIQSIGDGIPGRCWGGQFDRNSEDSGFGIWFDGFLEGAMGRISHDLVVPTHSALAFVNPEPPVTCSHVTYFLDDRVKSAIQSYFTSQESPAAGQAASITTI
jgi:hypothetical protein